MCRPRFCYFLTVTVSNCVCHLFCEELKRTSNSWVTWERPCVPSSRGLSMRRQPPAFILSTQNMQILLRTRNFILITLFQTRETLCETSEICARFATSVCVALCCGVWRTWDFWPIQRAGSCAWAAFSWSTIWSSATFSTCQASCGSSVFATLRSTLVSLSCCLTSEWSEIVLINFQECALSNLLSWRAAPIHFFLNLIYLLFVNEYGLPGSDVIRNLKMSKTIITWPPN